SKEHELSYVGTHDNESLRTWYHSLNRDEKKVLDKFIRNKYPESDVLNGILKYAFNLKSNYIILSVVDILLDARRINLPGSVGSPNWEYKLKDFRALSNRLKTVNKKRMRDKK
ncbi:MAG: 4-alpha-glucanotransferase, partial [Erysipelotrichaceae bacterium]|nr:4-alpha-glucanotransferase [Erysipelotrichaceae bacterium]